MSDLSPEASKTIHIILLIVIIFVAIVQIFFNFYYKDRRVKYFRKLANRNGWIYQTDLYDLSIIVPGFVSSFKNSGFRISNILQGKLNGLKFLLFEQYGSHSPEPGDHRVSGFTQIAFKHDQPMPKLWLDRRDGYFERYFSEINLTAGFDQRAWLKPSESDDASFFDSYNLIGAAGVDEGKLRKFCTPEFQTWMMHTWGQSRKSWHLSSYGEWLVITETSVSANGDRRIYPGGIELFMENAANIAEHFLSQDRQISK